MSAYDYKVLSSNGDLVDLSHYKGHVTLFVNVSCFDDKAKKCYELLATVYQKYKDEDLAVLLFPCSQFGSKETSPEKEIQFLQSSNLSDAGIIFKELEVFANLILEYSKCVIIFSSTGERHQHSPTIQVPEKCETRHRWRIHQMQLQPVHS